MTRGRGPQAGRESWAGVVSVAVCLSACLVSPWGLPLVETLRHMAWVSREEGEQGSSVWPSSRDRRRRLVPSVSPRGPGI